MTEQHALWVDPHWSDSYSVGDRVRSTYTNNEGTVVTVVTGRHLMIRWQKWRNEPDGYLARHSSALGLERL